MTIQVTKNPINLREKLNELETNKGIKGNEILQAETAQEVRSLIGAGRKNLIINGGFDVWQRGTSLTSGTAFLADRWINSVSETQSRQTFTVGQTDVPGNPIYYHRSSGGALTFYDTSQRIEDVRLTAGREVTLSYWAKASSAVVNYIYTTQIFGTGGSGALGIERGTANITTSWAKYTHTFTVASITGKTVGAGSCLRVYAKRTNAANILVDIANVQLELGSVATDFEHRSYGEELALCQRYYATGKARLTFNGTSGRYSFRTLGQHNMRTNPTVTGSFATQGMGTILGYGQDGVSGHDLRQIYVQTAVGSGADGQFTYYADAEL